MRASRCSITNGASGGARPPRVAMTWARRPVAEAEAEAEAVAEVEGGGGLAGDCSAGCRLAGGWPSGCGLAGVWPSGCSLIVIISPCGLVQRGASFALVGAISLASLAYLRHGCTKQV